VATQPVSNPTYEVPKGKVAGGFYLIDQAALAKATQSIALNKLVNFGQQPFHLPTNRSKILLNLGIMPPCVLCLTASSHFANL
jgi:hypothetical protein